MKGKKQERVREVKKRYSVMLEPSIKKDSESKAIVKERKTLSEKINELLYDYLDS